MDENMKEEKELLFLKGMVIGALISLVAVILTVGGISLYRNWKVSQSQFGETGGQQEASVDSLKDIINKMELLQEYIDREYLFDIDYNNVADHVYAAMLEGLDDPYSVYYTKEKYQALMESTNGSYYGIGASVQKDEETGAVKIVGVFEGSPAEKAGIVAEDLITRIAGTETADLELDDAVALMKGEEGTTVDLQIYRSSTEEYLELVVTRGKVDLITVTGEMLENGIGYIYISEFDSVTPKQFDAKLKELQEQELKGLIIDVRNNPGGLLTAVNDMLDKLLPEGTLVYTEYKNGKRQTYSSDKNCLDIPMVVLINGNSASASEIFAGAMQDFEWATILGTQSFGKGIVQTIRPLMDGTAIKLTIARYFTPSGVCIHGKGITPDVVLEYDSAAVEGLETVEWQDDNQLYAGYELLLKEVSGQ